MIVSVLVTIATIGCGQSSTQPTTAPTLPTTKMNIAGKEFLLEIARTNKTRETGLMYRDALPADRGMIFVFNDNTRRAFWMRNTRIPLDIFYLSPDGVIVSIHSMKPYDLTSTPSAAPAMYAIEVNAGVATALGLRPGDKIEIPPEARAAEE